MRGIIKEYLDIFFKLKRVYRANMKQFIHWILIKIENMMIIMLMLIHGLYNIA